MEFKKEVYTVDKVIEEAKNIVTICLVPESGIKLKFKSGQFVQVELVDNPNKLPSKSYSISSTENDPFISISVKKTGPFSSVLHGLGVGDKLFIMGPLGSFFVRDSMKKIVFLAGGIGIAPFYSMVKDFYERGDQEKEVYLFYSSKTKEDIAFYTQLKDMKKVWDGLHIIHFLTQDNKKIDGVREYQRIDASVLRKYAGNPDSFYYFVCGSVPFVTEVSKIIESQGVSEKKIFAELFY